MAIADMYVETALAEMKDRLFAGTLADFQYVFDPRIDAQITADVWNMIMAWGKEGLQIESAFSPAVYPNANAIISVVDEEANPDGPPMFNGGDVRNLDSTPTRGREYSMPEEDLVGIYIMTPNKPVLRLLDLLVKSTIFSATAWLVQNGLSGPIWLRTSQLAPVKEMTGTETVLKLVKKQTWKIIDTLTVRPFGGVVITPKKIVVHAVGTYVTAVPDPDTRTMSPLASTSEGRVTPVLGGSGNE